MVARRSDVEFEREFGRMGEALANAKEDRRELKEALEKLGEQFEGIRSAFNGLNQTVQSAVSQIVSLNSERCGERLTVLEMKVKFFETTFGDAKSLIWKVLAALIVSGLAGSGGAKLLQLFHL